MRRRPIAELERDRFALSLRGIERRYGYSREYVGERIRTGEIPATPHGRALLVLVSDFEAWMRMHALRPSSAAAAVERRLAREARRDATP